MPSHLARDRGRAARSKNAISPAVRPGIPLGLQVDPRCRARVGGGRRPDPGDLRPGLPGSPSLHADRATRRLAAPHRHQPRHLLPQEAKACPFPARLYMAPDRRDYDRAEARDVVEKAMARLSPKLRAAVVLHYYEGLTREEIAEVLGVPAGTVASRIAKAVAIMRKAMGSDQPGDTARSSSEGALRGR